MLVDGFRLNDSQSGHHNGEIPVARRCIDRIEVVYGAGVRRPRRRRARRHDQRHHPPRHVRDGERRRRVSTATPPSRRRLSGRILPPRLDGHRLGQPQQRIHVRSRLRPGRRRAVRGEAGRGLTVDVRHQRRAFGANGFYGASPSKEWTDLTLAGRDLEARAALVGRRGAWRGSQPPRSFSLGHRAARFRGKPPPHGRRGAERDVDARTRRRTPRHRRRVGRRRPCHIVEPRRSQILAGRRVRGITAARVGTSHDAQWACESTTTRRSVTA